jgi:hypothetical protein
MLHYPEQLAKPVSARMGQREENDCYLGWHRVRFVRCNRRLSHLFYETSRIARELARGQFGLGHTEIDSDSTRKWREFLDLLGPFASLGYGSREQLVLKLSTREALSTGVREHQHFSPNAGFQL